MPRRFVNQLGHGDSVDDLFLVADKQLRANRQGNLYLHLDLRDKTGVINARFWNATESLARTFETGDYLRVKGKVQVFQGGLQLILSHVETADSSGIRTDDFLPRSSQNIAALTNRLRELLFGLDDPHVRALCECFLMDDVFLDKFTRAPAGISNHHAYRGGLLEHVVTVMNLAIKVAELYPEINRDLLLAGVFLHDVGKVDELTYESGFAYSDEGQLIGHLVMGVEMIQAKVIEAERLTGEPFPPETLLRLKHMIVSHHGTHEFGSPRLPMTPEGIALHYLDNLDAKIHAFTREIRDDPVRESRWTPFHQGLGRRVFKGAPASENGTGEPDM